MCSAVSLVTIGCGSRKTRVVVRASGIKAGVLPLAVLSIPSCFTVTQTGAYPGSTTCANRSKTSSASAFSIAYLKMGGKGQASKPGLQSQSQAAQGTGRSRKANIVFPVGRIQRLMKQEEYAKRISGQAAVSIAAVLEFLTEEILELAGNAAKDNKKKRINPHYIMTAIQSDHELPRLFPNVDMPEIGAMPSTKVDLQPEPAAKKKKKSNKKTASGNELGQSRREGSQGAVNSQSQEQSQEV